MPLGEKIHESKYGGTPNNFHVTKAGDTLRVELTYPPWTDADNDKGQCRHVYVNQEAVRASDGVRLHYDYERDGFVVEQPRYRLVALGNNTYEDAEDWIEVAFCQSWKFRKEETVDDYVAADAQRAQDATPPKGTT